MSKKSILLSLVSVVLISSLGIGVYSVLKPQPVIEERFVQSVRNQQGREQDNEAQEPIEKGTTVNVTAPGDYVLLPNPSHIYQTFNNCGPATLSMMLSYYGTNVSQQELGNKMRPYQNPQGDNDDKTIFSYEFVDWAESYGLNAVSRVNGDIELLKKLTANGFPVVVKTWLNDKEDIGHFRVVRGYDEKKEVVIQDDSYQGPYKRYSYYDFLSLWQPFNYNYIIIYREDQEDLLSAILGEEMNSDVAWKNANQRASREAELNPESVYPRFNLSTSYYHMGQYQQSVDAFEAVENRLPRRMLWYQIEPISSYKELGNYDKVFQIADDILGNGNRAYSELYYIKGEIYLEQGNEKAARDQFQLALQYNENFQQARDNLDEME